MGQRACDPRLLGHAPATRSFIASAVTIGIASALLVIAQAWLLAEVISTAFAAGTAGAHVRGALEALACVVVARSLLAWATQVAASRSAARAKSQLRRSLLKRAATIGRDGLASEGTGELATLASRGIDALDALLLAVPAAALPRRDRAVRSARGDRLRGLDLGGDHRRDAAADPAVHGPGRGQHA